MRALSRPERALASVPGCALCVSAVLVLSRGTGAAAIPPSVPAALLRAEGGRAATSAIEVPALRLSRDPFVADAGPMPDGPLATLPVLPPNRGIVGAPPSAGPAVVVRAVVLGARPMALVEFGQQTIVVKPGDALAASRVAAIDVAGIVLSDGRRMTLGSGAP
jgi:hypothetical protein